MTIPQAIIFDMDGTLTDSEEEWDIVRRGMAADEGLSWPEASTKAMMGMSTPEWSAHLSEVVGLSGTPEELATRTIDGMADAYRDGRIPALPDAEGAVRRMAALAPLGVASSSPRRLIETGLAMLGVGDAVTVVVSTEEVKRGKPAPDGYLAACAALDADPSACLAIEDSANGIRSALAAGMKVVVVPPRFHPPAPEVLDAASAVIESLADLDADLVARLFA